MSEYPRLLHTAIDSTDARALAEFYRELLGLRYRQGDEPPAGGGSGDAGWLVLVDSGGDRKLAFQQVDRLERTTWPEHDVPMQMHLDFTVPRREDLERGQGVYIILYNGDQPDEIFFAGYSYD